MSPWFSICKMAPSTPCWLNEKMPSVTNPMWLTELYAINFFRSVWTIATIAP